MQAPLGPVRWTVVIPYFNEEAFLGHTLESLSRQTLRPFRVVLVDNGSTDGSAGLAAEWAARQVGIDVQLLAEPVPGQVHALALGIGKARTEFLAVADADTFYPPHYLATADRLLSTAPADVVGYIGHDVAGPPGGWGMRSRRWFYSRVAPFLLPRQAHGGGYAHCMRLAAFRAAGSYSPALWPYVLKDHELVHRLWQHGRIAMNEALWVVPSARRTDRRAVRWTLGERLLYHGTPPVLKDWFWYRFMKDRFERRGQRDVVLRQRQWADARQPAL